MGITEMQSGEVRGRRRWTVNPVYTASKPGLGNGKKKKNAFQKKIPVTILDNNTDATNNDSTNLLLLLLLYLASTFCWHGPLDRPVGGFLRYQSVDTGTGPTASCGIRTTPRTDILSPEIQPSDPLVE